MHLTGGGGEAGPQTRVPPVALSRLTRGGVTTAIGVLGTDDAIRTPAELVTVARGLVAEGLSAYCLTGGYHVPPATVTGERAAATWCSSTSCSAWASWRSATTAPASRRSTSCCASPATRTWAG